MNKVIQEFNKLIFNTKKTWRLHGNDIKFWGGIAGIITSEILACRATLKVTDVLDDIQYALDDVKDMKESVGLPGFDYLEGYDEKAYRNDIFHIYLNGVLKIAGLYVVPFGIGAASVCALVNTHSELKEEKAQTVAALSALASEFKGYRQNVIDDQGEAKDLEYLYGVKESEVEEVTTNAKGTKKVVKKKQKVVEEAGLSIYARFFGPEEYADMFPVDPRYLDLGYSKEYERRFNEFNESWLRLQEDLLNKDCKRLTESGHGGMTMNQALERFGYEPTIDGYKLCKIWDPNGPDRQISLHIYEPYNKRAVNGCERVWLIDFVDFASNAVDEMNIRKY